jgi:hypothetical protein
MFITAYIPSHENTHLSANPELFLTKWIIIILEDKKHGFQ